MTHFADQPLNLLVVYGTTEGHTRTVAEYIGDTAREGGHRAEVKEVDELGSVALEDWDASGASPDERQSREFVLAQREFLGSVPSAFFR